MERNLNNVAREFTRLHEIISQRVSYGEIDPQNLVSLYEQMLVKQVDVTIEVYREFKQRVADGNYLHFHIPPDFKQADIPSFLNRPQDRIVKLSVPFKLGDGIPTFPLESRKEYCHLFSLLAIGRQYPRESRETILTSWGQWVAVLWEINGRRCFTINHHPVKLHNSYCRTATVVSS